MKATGIVRRIDGLGRVVIPKEIRRTMRIREGDPLEIFTNREGEVILKKYSPIGELGEFAVACADSLNETIGIISCVADKDTIIAVSGTPKKQLLNKSIGYIIENSMAERRVLFIKDSCYLTADEDISYHAAIVAPVIASGDAIGAVVLATKDIKIKMGAMESKIAETAASFLAKQMEL